jgi:hypothetical protein
MTQRYLQRISIEISLQYLLVSVGQALVAWAAPPPLIAHQLNSRFLQGLGYFLFVAFADGD